MGLERRDRKTPNPTLCLSYCVAAQDVSLWVCSPRCGSHIQRGAPCARVATCPWQCVLNAAFECNTAAVRDDTGHNTRRQWWPSFPADVGIIGLLSVGGVEGEDRVVEFHPDERMHCLRVESLLVQRVSNS